jgi:hypothetical protein
MTTSLDNVDYDFLCNVDSYSDSELHSLLGFNVPPQDDILETRIVQLVQQYRKSNNEILVAFFTDVYNRLFDSSGDEEENNSYETDENIDYAADAAPLLSSVTKQNIDSNGATREGLGLTTPLPDAPPPPTTEVTVMQYPAGNLNPLLNETYRRLICIDSQHRDANFTNSTDFILNFSEILRGVVKMQLYSITIPYHWYTISNAYGSNFFILRGNRPGINNIEDDIRIQIPPGSYTTSQLKDAVTANMSTLGTTYPAIEFGDTHFECNSASALASLTVNIRNAFNETHYTTSFNNYQPPNLDVSYRRQNLSAFLGFNNSEYNIGVVYSEPSNIADYSKLSIDASNNTINIIQYVSSGLSVLSASTNGVPLIGTQQLDISGVPLFDVSGVPLFNTTVAQVMVNIPIIIPIGSYTLTGLIDTINKLLYADVRIGTGTELSYGGSAKNK